MEIERGVGRFMLIFIRCYPPNPYNPRSIFSIEVAGPSVLRVNSVHDGYGLLHQF